MKNYNYFIIYSIGIKIGLKVVNLVDACNELLFVLLVTMPFNHYYQTDASRLYEATNAFYTLGS